MSSVMSPRGLQRRNRKLDREKSAQHVHLDHGEGIAFCGRTLWIVVRVNGAKEEKPLKPYTRILKDATCPLCLTEFAARRLRNERD